MPKKTLKLHKIDNPHHIQLYADRNGHTWLRVKATLAYHDHDKNNFYYVWQRVDIEPDGTIMFRDSYLSGRGNDDNYFGHFKRWILGDEDVQITEEPL